MSKKICASWTRAILLLSTIIGMSTIRFAFPPFNPKKPTDLIFFFFANLIALMTFNEFPDVLIASKTSPEFPKAFKFLSKIFENHNRYYTLLMWMYLYISSILEMVFYFFLDLILPTFQQLNVAHQQQIHRFHISKFFFILKGSIK